MDEKSEITEKLDELDKALSELRHRLYPYMIDPISPPENSAETRATRSPVYERINSATENVLDMAKRIVP